MSSISPFLLTIPALAAVLGLIWLAQVLYRFGMRSGWLRLPAAGVTPASRRLAVVQALPIDAKRRLHLVRCDSGHVLLLTGGPQDLMLGWVPAEPAP